MARTTERTNGLRLRVVTVIALLALALGGTMGAATVAFTAQRSLTGSPAAHARTMPATPDSYIDKKSVSVTVPEKTQWVAHSPTGGVLRASNCAPGTQLPSGSAAFTLSDAKVLALHLEQPAYRDFTAGIKGEDVRQLQTELARLGLYNNTTTGTFDAATGAAVRALKKNAGWAQPTATLPLAELLWIPQESVTPTSCTASLGTAIQPGDDLFAITTLPPSITVTLPEDRAAGERQATIGRATTTIPEDGVITDAAFLAALYALPQLNQAEGNTKPVTINTRLVTPISSYRVPLSALYRFEGSYACVESDGSPNRVQVVGSEYGSAIVVADQPLGEVAVYPGESAPSCT